MVCRDKETLQTTQMSFTGFSVNHAWGHLCPTTGLEAVLRTSVLGTDAYSSFGLQYFYAIYVVLPVM